MNICLQTLLLSSCDSILYLLPPINRDLHLAFGGDDKLAMAYLSVDKKRVCKKINLESFGVKVKDV